MKVWLVVVEQYNYDGDLTGVVEITVYATKQTAQQHADRDGGEVVGQDVLTKLRAY